VRVLVDSAGTLRRKLDYDSFGRVTADRSFEANGQATETKLPHLFSYTSRIWDSVGNLYNYRSRWYDASVGVFISEDSVGFDSGDWNLHRYVFNNPLGHTDPTGEGLAAPLIVGGILLASGLGLWGYSEWSLSNPDSSWALQNRDLTRWMRAGGKALTVAGATVLASPFFGFVAGAYPLAATIIARLAVLGLALDGINLTLDYTDGVMDDWDTVDWIDRFAPHAGGSIGGLLSSRLFSSGHLVGRAFRDARQADRAIAVWENLMRAAQVAREELARAGCLTRWQRLLCGFGRKTVATGDFRLVGESPRLLRAYSGRTNVPGFARYIPNSGRFLKAGVVEGSLRDCDAEAKILENIYRLTNARSAGILRLWFDGPSAMCRSCGDMLSLFRTLRPNIYVIPIWSRSNLGRIIGA
jgi:RHS repeat-associated protein